MRIRVLAAIGTVLALAGCGWTQPGFDAGHSQANGLETSLTAANVGGLQQHTIAVPSGAIRSYFVVRNWLVVNTDGGAIAFDRTTCPRTDDGPCTPVWTRPGERFRSSDGISVMFFSTGINTFEAVDFSGAHLWSGVPVAEPSSDGSPPGFGGDAFAIAGPNLLVTLDVAAGHGNRSRTMNVFPIAGCAAPSCGPASHYPLALIPQGVNPRFPVGGDRVIGGLFTLARDLGTGSVVWSSECCSVPVIVHGRDAYSGTPPPTTFQVFDVAGVRNCGGTPRVCAPLRTLTTDAMYAVSDTIAVGHTRPTSTTAGLSLFSTDGSGCRGVPQTCGPIATTSSLGSGVTDAVLTARLVFAAGVSSAGSRLQAFDAGLRTGCSGAPTICSPLVDLPISSASAGSIEVWDGRVYALAADGVLHVFALPAARS